MSAQRYTFSNNWFATHEPHWRAHLLPWAGQRGPLSVLEIGSYEGQSACWLLDNLLQDPRSRLTCADLWQQSSGDRLYPDDIDAVFDRFQANIRATSRAQQVTTLRGDSKATLPTLADESFDLVYVDGDHSAQGVCFDSLAALRLVKPGGMVLWDDYFWSATVKAGVDLACRAAGASVERMGENACFRKMSPLPASPRGRIIGLVPGRNEGARLEFCLRALADYTDAIVYLDDCSTDDTAQRVENLAAECRVERILGKTEWLRDEPGDRNRLLHAGRELGGTHFVMLDADEAFTANFERENLLRRLILSLQPGEQLSLAWIQFWRGLDFFRHDQSIWTNNYKSVIFCDDTKCGYASEFIHTPRSPANLSGPTIQIPGYDFGLMHFQFANWQNLLLKQAWYRCLERVRDPQKPAQAINELYAPSENETGLGLKPVPATWLDYPFLDRAALLAPDNWRRQQIEAWLKEFGAERFQDLEIAEARLARPLSAPKTRDPERPLVSAIVSTYNGEKFIGGCLEDLAAQTLPPDDLEIIVIDSGSPQNEGAIVREHQKRATNIVYLRTERETIYAAWNRAAQLARGRYLTNANVDDRHAPDALEKLARALDDHPDIDVVYANSAVTKTANGRWGNAPLFGFLRWPRYDRHLLFSLCFLGPQPMWRKSAHERFGYFDPKLTSSGDFEFWLRISAKARFLHLPETLGLYLDHPESVEHAAPLVSQQEADAARQKHWPAEWGRRPKPVGNFFQPLTFADTPETLRIEIADNAPLVSVIIPTHSRPETLREAVRSVLAQTMQDFEIIVVNDAGPDVSDLLRSLGSSEKIVSHRQETSRERSAARNLGLSKARGRYISYLDDDDIFYPDHLEILTKVLRLTGAKVAYVDSVCATPIAQGSRVSRREPFLSVDFDRKRLLASNYIPILCLMHARECLQASGAFDEQLNSHEDWELFLRLSRHFDFTHIKKVTCEFRSRLETEAEKRARYKGLLGTAELVHERYQMFAGLDPEVAALKQAYIDGIKEKCKPIPADGMKWVKYRLTRPFQNLRHSLKKRMTAAK